MRRWLIRSLSVSLSLLALLVLAGYYLQPAGSEEVLERLTVQDIEYHKIKVRNEDSLIISAYCFGNEADPPLLLIHGSPGDWSAWENIIINETIRNHYFVIAMDRPGYGHTSVPAQAELQEQAKVALTLIDSLEIENITVVGHSYGGAVVEQLLIDRDSVFKLGFIIAGTLSPVHMAPRWYNKVANWTLVKVLLSKDLLASNLEMMGLPSSLDYIEDKLSEISTPIILMQGEDDVLVPFETVTYYKQVKPDGVEYHLLADINHFIPWTHPNLINNILINQIEK